MREYIKLIFGDADLPSLSISISQIFDREIKLKKLEDDIITSFVFTQSLEHYQYVEIDFAAHNKIGKINFHFDPIGENYVSRNKTVDMSEIS